METINMVIEDLNMNQCVYYNFKLNNTSFSSM